MNRSIKTTAAVTAALLLVAAGAFLAGRTSVSGFDDKDSKGRQTTSKVRHVLPCLFGPSSAIPLERVSF